MQKGKLIFLIIILTLITGASFWYFSSMPKTNNTSNTDIPDTNFISEFFPFGKSEKVTEPNNTNNVTDITDENNDENITPEIKNQPLMKISKGEVAGFGIFMKERFKEVPEIIPTTPATQEPTTEPTKTDEIKTTPPATEFVPILKYVDRATGNIYQTFIDKIDLTQTTTTFIPKIYDAYFGKNGESVVMRYLKNNKTIETFTGTTPKEILGGDSTNDTELKGSFLPENIKDISLSFDKSKIFYLLGIGDSVVGINSSTFGDKKKQVFSSAFTEWLSWWPNEQMVTLTTKPSFAVAGYMFAVNPNKKDFNKILGGINGLTTLTSPNGELVLYNDNSLNLKIFNTKNNTTTTVGAKTMPEKCTWDKTSTYVYCGIPKDINSNEFPDVWYQGEVSFNDIVWKIEGSTGNATIVSELTQNEIEQNIDITKPSLDENEEHLFFINKKDSSLWMLKIK